MTRTWWVAYATAATCVLMACGSSDDGRIYQSPDAGVDDAGSDAGWSKDASQISDDAGSASGENDDGSGSGSASGSGSGSGSSGGGAVSCEPGGACGGLYSCVDDCYSDKCCQLDCQCSDPSGLEGQLECAMIHCQN